MAQIKDAISPLGLEDLVNRIHCIDALDLFRLIPSKSIDMCLCDLPYGVTQNKWDEIIPLAPMWQELNRVCKDKAAIVLTAVQPFTSLLVSSNIKQFRTEWVYEKVFTTGHLNAHRYPMRAHENILVFSKKPPNYYPVMEKGQPYSKLGHSASSNYGDAKRFWQENKGVRYPRSIIKINNGHQGTKVHPTEKPLTLFTYLIKTYSLEGEIVLDMCVGSGTTAVAASQLNRQFVCGDISPHYAKIARGRLAKKDLWGLASS